jgi:hypothetical protein
MINRAVNRIEGLSHCVGDAKIISFSLAKIGIWPAR